MKRGNPRVKRELHPHLAKHRHGGSLMRLCALAFARELVETAQAKLTMRLQGRKQSSWLGSAPR
jgi:hypothetical protein